MTTDQPKITLLNLTTVVVNWIVMEGGYRPTADFQTIVAECNWKTFFYFEHEKRFALELIAAWGEDPQQLVEPTLFEDVAKSVHEYSLLELSTRKTTCRT